MRKAFRYWLKRLAHLVLCENPAEARFQKGATAFVPVNAETWQQAPFLLEVQRRVIRELRNFNRTSTRLAIGVIFIAVLQLAVAGVQLYIAAKG